MKKHIFKAGDIVQVKKYCTRTDPGKNYLLKKHNGVLKLELRPGSLTFGCSCKNTNWKYIKHATPKILTEMLNNEAINNI